MRMIHMIPQIALVICDIIFRGIWRHIDIIQIESNAILYKIKKLR